ncbi:MAG TPA: hypothetical protein VND91_09285 [Candidatus Saccharimonadia bacterium]|nr:hypothetical protein [Candidatus Saccharimonadia bacterium]
MPYTQVALCIVGVALFFNAGKLEARSGAADHSILWSALSLLVSVAVLVLGAGWLAWLIAQLGLFLGIAIVRAALEARAR